MKTLFTSIAIFVFSFTLTQAQSQLMASSENIENIENNENKVYFDSEMNRTNEDNAQYHGTIEHVIGDYELKVYRSGNQLKYEGTYSDKQCTIENGNFKYYYYNGQIESEGQFRNGIKVGEWKRNDHNGNALPSKYYSEGRFQMLSDLRG